MRVVAESLARMDIRDMHFNIGNADRFQRIGDGDAGVAVSSGIDNDKADPLIVRTLNPIHQFAFMVALESFELQPRDPCSGFHFLVDVGQRRLAVDIGFARAKQVQVGAMQNQNPCLAACAFPSSAGLFTGSWLRHGASLPQIQLTCPVGNLKQRNQGLLQRFFSEATQMTGDELAVAADDERERQALLLISQPGNHSRHLRWRNQQGVIDEFFF